MTTGETLQKGMSGPAVRAAKEMLFRLRLYAPEIAAITKDRFGSDTFRAVCAFQRQNGLPETGVIDAALYARLTEAAAQAAQAETPVDGAEGAAAAETETADLALPANIGPAAAKAIRAALGGASAVRRGVVQTALSFAYDPAVPRAYPLSLYIRGGNLYNTDLSPNVITLARIARGAAAQPAYYDGGRREMMEAAVRNDPHITGADCSGGVVGLLRHARCTAAGFDATANGLAARCRDVGAGALLPADFVHRDGHIGLYAGGGYAVEWMGGAYGCQLTVLSDRRGFDFVRGALRRMSAWTRFLRPSYYEAR